MKIYSDHWFWFWTQKIIISFHTTEGKGIFAISLMKILMKSKNILSGSVRKRRRIRVLLAALTVLVVIYMAGALHGRFNFKYTRVDIEYNKLPAALEGFTIVHISDLHLISFNRHPGKLAAVTDSINALEADIIVNTGDFVTLHYDEMEPFTGTLGRLRAKHGVYAIPGNHDTGLYSKKYNKDNYHEHLDVMGSVLRAAGHIYLQDSTAMVKFNEVSLSLTGVATYGRVPDLSYGDLDSSLLGNDSSSFRILLSHDPNHWVREIQERSDIDLTLSGHTHGMQMGILFPGFQLSPASLLYPAWSGLYGENGNYLYVNRGLGTIGMPARIGMSPEITIITLKTKD